MFQLRSFNPEPPQNLQISTCSSLLEFLKFLHSSKIVRQTALGVVDVTDIERSNPRIHNLPC